MRIGRMYTVLRWRRPTASVTATGAREVVFADQGAIRAERVSMRATERAEAGEMYADMHAEYNVRHQHGIRRGDRVAECDEYGTDNGAEMEVTAVIANRRKGFKTIICDRVNL